MIKNLNSVFNLLDKNTKLKFYLFLPLGFLHGLFEAFSITLVLPLISFLTKKNDLLNITGSSIFPSFFDKIFSNFENLNQVMVFFCLIIILKNLILIFIINKKYQLNSIILIELSKKLYKNYLNLPYNVINNFNSSKIIKNLTTECLMTARSFASSTVVVVEFLNFTVLIILMFIFNYKLTLCLFAAVIFFVLIYNFIIKNKLSRYSLQRIEGETRRLRNIQETFQGILSVKLFNLQKYLLNQFSATDKVYNILAKERTISESPRYCIELYFTFLLLIFLINFSTSNHENLIFLISFFILSLVRIVPSINKIISSLSTIKYCDESLKIIFDQKLQFNDFEKENFNQSTKIKIKNFNNYISFNNIYFKFNNNKKYLFKNFSFTIKKNHIIGIKGPSGSGKTTLINIMTGLYAFEKGSLRIDDKDLNIKETNISQLFSYTPQNTFIFNDTIRKNLMLFADHDEKSKDVKDDETQLNKIIEDYELKSLITSKSHGLETILSEAGGNISGGQKQRLGICRSLLSSRPIIIFDESTSSLDQETQERVINKLKYLKNNKTLIFISHDPSVLKNCDYIIDLFN